MHVDMGASTESVLEEGRAHRWHGSVGVPPAWNTNQKRPSGKHCVHALRAALGREVQSEAKRTEVWTTSVLEEHDILRRRPLLAMENQLPSLKVDVACVPLASVESWERNLEQVSVEAVSEPVDLVDDAFRGPAGQTASGKTASGHTTSLERLRCCILLMLMLLYMLVPVAFVFFAFAFFAFGLFDVVFFAVILFVAVIFGVFFAFFVAFFAVAILFFLALFFLAVHSLAY